MRSFLAPLQQSPALWNAAFLVLLAPLAAVGEAVRPAAAEAGSGAAVEPAQALRHLRVEGTVLLPGGGPARGAVVVSSAGGQAAVGEDGSFALELAVAPEALAVELTAVANGPRGTLSARRRLDGLRDGPFRHAGTLTLVESQGCELDWIPTFGVLPGTNLPVLAVAVFDDGSGAGPALYAGGEFTSAGDTSANGIAKWDGQAWRALGSGVSTPLGAGAVQALAVFDDGAGGGPALYAGGLFKTAGGQDASGIAKWDGQGWSGLSTGIAGGVRALAVFDDGSGGGSALYAAGDFAKAGGQSASCVAKWDGQGWSTLGSGTAGMVKALAVFDDGSGAGPALYAGGFFQSAGGQSASNIARWDGQGWSALGSGMDGAVGALAVFDDGSGAGPALYAGGYFLTAGGVEANRIARWNGQAWSALGSGAGAGVEALAVFDDGSGGGPALYVGGLFDSAGGQEANGVAKWDGQSWSALGSGTNGNVRALAVIEGVSGAGPALCAGGVFDSAGGLGANHIAQWDGQVWSVFGSGLNGGVDVLAVFDDGGGGGPALYAGGGFTHAGGQSVNGIARWDGGSWSALASGLNSAVQDLAVFDDGGGAGPMLHAAGSFTSTGDGSQMLNRIARWDGQSWSALGSGLDVSPGLIYAEVRSLAVFDDGGGPALYAGGHFTDAGGVAVQHIAKWNGTSWAALSSGVGGGPVLVLVRALTVFDDGSGAGPALYAGGDFTSAGGQAADRIARWDGQVWSALGSGLSNPVEALTVFDDGSGAGPALYVGGFFSFAGGQSASRIARWDGQAWSALGSGMNSAVRALGVFDDGSGAGPALYAGGQFTTAGGLAANRIAKWDGQSWSALGSGMDALWVDALAAFDDGAGGGPALYAGGDFTMSPGGDAHLAKWGCKVVETLPGCFGNPAVLASTSSEASIGSTFDVWLSGSQITSGLGVLFFGLEGVDAAGCGLFAPGLGELLLALAPQPREVASGSLSAGSVAFALPVPAQPSLVGAEIAFQGAVAGVFDPGLPLELSNALLVTITQ